MLETRIEIETDGGCVDAWAACPEHGAWPPVLLLLGRGGLTDRMRTAARRLAARGYFVLAPDWLARPISERRSDLEACLDHLADERRADDERVGVAGWGAGAALALRLAAARSERIGVAAAFDSPGFGPTAARDIAERLNGLLHLGYGTQVPRGLATLEAALVAAGVDFEAADYPPDALDLQFRRLLDLLDRALAAPRPRQAPAERPGAPC